MLRKQNPRELSNQFGYASLERSDLLALVLRYGNKRNSIFTLSKQLDPLFFGSIKNSLPTHEFRKLLTKNIILGNVQLHTIMGMYELLLRQQIEKYAEIKYTKPLQFRELFHFLTRKKQEYVYGVYLSPRLHLIHKELLAKGTTDSVVIDVRDVLYFGIKHRVRHIVLLHNHPTGNPSPSIEDIEQTRNIAAAANLLSMNLVDHIIIGKEGYYSFKESTSML